MAEGPPQPIDTTLVRELAAILNDTDLSEIEVERGDLKIRVARSLTVAAAPPAYAPAPVAAHAASTPAADAPAPSALPAPPAGDAVKSPMVGTVYMSPQPGAAPFVKVGDSVSAGQTLMIIEAMKTMNPIPAAKAGVVRAILVSDGDPVEFGEPLAIIE
jgi:acetyl-CoA carboxylase biotin carboxyl carrier protein